MMATPTTAAETGRLVPSGRGGSQPTINIGVVGHVAHGKSTLVKALSGVATQKYNEELKQNITIKLGYANAKIYRGVPPRPGARPVFCSRGSNGPDTFVSDDGTTMVAVRHVSFVDCPGHEVLMATMLNGAAVMDAALLLVAANEPCPQPQTLEHLAALEAMQLDAVILQNKVDLVGPAAATRQHRDIVATIRGTAAEGAPVIPIAAMANANLDVVCEHIAGMPEPVRDLASPARMVVVRSFCVSKPGATPDELRGGIAGGSILRGSLRVGEQVELRPGVVRRDKATGRVVCSPIRTRIESLFSEKTQLAVAGPGGLIGIGTLIDPHLTKADRLVGQVLGPAGTLPDVYVTLEASVVLLRNLLGSGKGERVRRLAKAEFLMVNTGSSSTEAEIKATKKDMVRLDLRKPVCAEVGEKITLSRRVGRNWRLIGWGTIRGGRLAELTPADDSGDGGGDGSVGVGPAARGVGRARRAAPTRSSCPDPVANEPRKPDEPGCTLGNSN